MKKKVIFLLFLCLVLTGCSKEQAHTWEEETVFGDIDTDVETVDIYGVEEKYEIDNYLNIEELNLTKPDLITTETFRIPYNRIAEQAELPYIMPTNYEIFEDEKDYITKEYSGERIGVYIRSDRKSEKLLRVYCEYPFSSKDEESFYQSVNRVFAPLFGGIPNVTKYDLNKIYFEIADALKKETGKYETSYNDISFSASRDYGYVYVTVSYNNLNLD